MKRTHIYRCWQERMLDDMTLHGYAQRTQEGYLRAAERLSEFCGGRSPRSVTIEELRQFFIYLKTVKVYSRPTCTSFICAIKFLFEKTLKRRWPQETILVRPPRQSRLPVILTLEEVGKILRAVREAHHRCCLGLIYSCGLRLGEGLSLKIEDIDAGRMVLHIRAAKGQKDRYVPLPERALLALRRQWRRHRNPTWLFPAPGHGGMGCPTAQRPMSRTSLQRAFRLALKATGSRKQADSEQPGPSVPSDYGALHPPHRSGTKTGHPTAQRDDRPLVAPQRIHTVHARTDGGFPPVWGGLSAALWPTHPAQPPACHARYPFVPHAVAGWLRLPLRPLSAHPLQLP